VDLGADMKEHFVRITRCTVRTRMRLIGVMAGGLKIDDANQKVKYLSIDASANVFDGVRPVFFFQEARGPISQAHAERFVKQSLGWKGEGNLYAVDAPLTGLYLAGKMIEPAGSPRSLADWRTFWGTAEANSIEGRVRYHGGDVLAKLESAPEKLTPEDF